ncbi:hypothetical protein BBK82_22050 [Lentzea guizhouensis]|uniref:Uncharacterized protein n=1 Tax=Lentzea guizhouensis TaxID=1586287 RepID=A0A1B2HKV5_9PSEU|nr:hypothetical protein BBK82_22050 [Lentzea guizhouensis]
MRRRWPGSVEEACGEGNSRRRAGPGTSALVCQGWPWEDQRAAARRRAARTRDRTVAVGSGGVASAFDMAVMGRMRTRRSTRSSSGPDRRDW